MICFVQLAFLIILKGWGGKLFSVPSPHSPAKYTHLSGREKVEEPESGPFHSPSTCSFWVTKWILDTSKWILIYQINSNNHISAFLAFFPRSCSVPQRQCYRDVILVCLQLTTILYYLWLCLGWQCF